LYFALTGRAVFQMQTADYRPMVLIGLGSVVALFGAFSLSAGFRRKRSTTRNIEPVLPFSTNEIAVGYVIAFVVSGVLREFAWSAPGVTQVLLVFTHVRYVLLFFLITRLSSPKPILPAIAVVLLFEVALGFTGFFAEFREPLLVTAVAIAGSMDRKKASTWLIIASVALLAVGSALLWTAIKPIVRMSYVSGASNIERLSSAATAAEKKFGPGESVIAYQGDTLVSRIWSVYFPALALKRVPSVLPYEHGAILRAAVDNVLTPRLFNPDKPSVPSPSDEVRKYAGVWVKGRESNTSIAFGYVGEAYVDFGLPWMFVPIFFYGLSLGFAYRWVTRNIRHSDLRTGATLVIFWSTLGSYESSWVMMIGPAIMTIAVLGGGAILVDRYLWNLTISRLSGSPAPIGAALSA